jgi:hypothetical protein
MKRTCPHCLQRTISLWSESSLFKPAKCVECAGLSAPTPGNVAALSIVAQVVAVAAIVVAFMSSSWWPIYALGAAFVLFALFGNALLALQRVTRSEVEEAKNWRKAILAGCAVVIGAVVAMNVLQ